MRNIHLYQQHQKKHLWQVEEPISSIYGSKILVVGTGDLGKEFAGKVKMMGAHTIGINRHPKLPLTAFDELYGIEEIETLLPHAVLSYWLYQAQQKQDISFKSNIMLE